MTPLKKLMDDLHVIRDMCLDDETYDDAASLDTLIEAVNRAQHVGQTRQHGVDNVEAVLASPALELSETVRELVSDALHGGGNV